MNNETITAAQAIHIAIQALRRGNKLTARRWAQRAAVLDPGSAEPWMILARIANPRAQVVYLEQALKAEPGNPIALEALRQSRKARPNPTEKVASPVYQPEQESVSLRPPVSQRSVGFWVLISGILFTVAMVIAVAFWLASTDSVFRVNAKIASHPGAGVPVASHLEVSSPTAIAFPTTTRTPFLAVTNTPTPTPTPLPTATATPSPVPPTDTPVPQIPERSFRANGKTILVSISEQHVYAYEGDRQVFSFAASTGRGNTTLAGNFRILDKIPNAYSAPWGFWMPNWMGIYWVGSNLENGFHSLPVLYNGSELWGDQIGTPITYGCVVLQPGNMKQLFDWADIGTPVQIVR